MKWIGWVSLNVIVNAVLRVVLEIEDPFSMAGWLINCLTVFATTPLFFKD